MNFKFYSQNNNSSNLDYAPQDLWGETIESRKTGPNTHYQAIYFVWNFK